MKTAEKRKYKGGDFGVNVGAKVPPATFNEIEDLAGVVRLLLSRGLAEYQRDEKLSARPTTPLAEPRAGYFSNDDKIETPPETFSVGDSASKEEV
ncbi:MAG: hypothetical protein M3Q91_17720 [Acidobacteriota bacterium]|nr:hypothetical protein [Acidobacteriota bacterium]